MSTPSVPASNADRKAQTSAPSSRHRLPLQFIWTVPFLLQVLVSIGSLGYCFWRSGEESVNRNLAALADRDRYLSETSLNQQFQGATQLTSILADDLNAGTFGKPFKPLNAAERDRLSTYLNQRRTLFSPQSILSIRSQSGQGLKFSSAKPTDRHAETAPLHLEIISNKDQERSTVYGANAQGKIGSVLKRYPQEDSALPTAWFDPARVTLAWQQAPIDNKPTWWAVRSLTLVDGKRGMVATGLPTATLERHLEVLDLQGTLLVVNSQGQLIAASHRDQAQQWLSTLAPQLTAPRQTSRSAMVTVGGQPQWVSITHWGEELGLDWRIVNLVPRSRLNHEIWQNYLHTALFSGAVLLSSLIIWTWTHQRLLRPMRRLNQAAQALAIGQESENLRSLSTHRIGEFGDLAQSLNQVALRLRDSSLSVVHLNQALFNSKKHLTILFEALPVGIMVYDNQGRCIYLNRTGQLLLGIQQMPQVPIEQIAQAYRIYRTGTNYLYPQAELPIVQALQGKAVYLDDLEIRRREMTMPLEVRATPINDASGNVVYAVQTFQNVITRKQAESALRQSEERIRRLAENIPGMVFRYVRRRDGSDSFTYVSPHCRDIFEIEPEQLMANTGAIWSMMVPEDAALMQGSAQVAIAAMEPWSMPYRIYTPSGEFKWLVSYASPVLEADGEIYWDGVVIDDTERKQAEAVMQDYGQTLEKQVQERTMALQQAMWELDRLATLDGLTQVANRRRFDGYLMQEWQRLARTLQPLSLILCDVDYFKRYNDHYGHQAGDLCLQMIAQAMDKVAKRPADLVARYGGEEFAVLLPQTDRNGAQQVAEALSAAIHALAIPHDTSQVSQYITMSIGIATMLPLQHQLPEELIKRADQALYLAKEQGRDRICHSPANPGMALTA